ncbi:MAG: helix-turn-helix transcriptional regulator [Flavobacteriaceae bacterium]|jgi:transcriptional regulator with XRE-family HTH domain|nr:helix-turn-helix transcriptional regulator [Flavobacteriaceae bacterium]
MELLEKISTEIKRLRKQKGLSQESLAFKIDIDRKYASLIEKGNTNLSFNYLKKVCDGLDTKLSDFFKNIEE